MDSLSQLFFRGYHYYYLQHIDFRESFGNPSEKGLEFES